MKNDRKKGLSIIVAIYNIENYIEKCIISIISQSYKNIDIILVNDGSTDNSLEICKKYQKKDSRIKVINKKNGGVVSARYEGLKIAKFDNVILIDGDDWLDNNYIEQFENYLETEFDILIARNYYESYEKKDLLMSYKLNCGDYTNKSLNNLMTKYLYFGEFFEFGISPCLWGKIFNKNKLLEIYKNVPKNITLGEDLAISLVIANQAKRIVIIENSGYYHYRQRNESMVNAYDKNLIPKVNNLKKYLNSIDFSDNLVSQIHYYYTWIIISVLKNQFKDKSKDSLTKLERLNDIYEELDKINIKGFKIKYKIIINLIKKKNFFVLNIIKKIYK